uniref:Zgc:136493 n=1 Tax=Haplochromis burtoni TaxID=8153 RepID=A0A3Q2WYN8_HAPBU
MAMGLLLASARKIIFKLEICIPQSLVGVEVTGSTLGIIGMGHIGYKIAQRSKGFDMKILYHNRHRSVEDEQSVGASYCENMDDLLREADFVVLVVNLSPETKGLISHRELSLMKPTATLVNVSRGLVVDQDALVKALQSGEIRAAALDNLHKVYIQEHYSKIVSEFVNLIVDPLAIFTSETLGHSGALFMPNHVTDLLQTD